MLSGCISCITRDTALAEAGTSGSLFEESQSICSSSTNCLLHPKLKSSCETITGEPSGFELSCQYLSCERYFQDVNKQRYPKSSSMFLVIHDGIYLDAICPVLFFPGNSGLACAKNCA